MPDIFTSKKNGNKTDRPGVDTDDQKENIAQEEKKNIRKEFIKSPKGEERHKLPGHTHNPLASYCYFPDHADFENKDPEEEVVLILRRHPITNLGWISFSFLLLIAPAFISILPFFETLPVDYQVILAIIWYLFSAAFVFEKFLGWYFNVNIVTDERLFDVDFIHLIYREMTEANIDQIQDVTVQIGGGIRTAFNYGDVLIQTAADVPRLEFGAVPYPDKVARVLRELRLEEEVEKLEGRIR